MAKSDLSDQFDSLLETWERAKDQINQTEIDLEGPSLNQIDEVIATIRILFDRSKSPPGFSPGFRVGQAVVALALPRVIFRADALAGGNATDLKLFLVDLSRALNGALITASFSDPHSRIGESKGLNSLLAEQLALVDTAQSELSIKTEELNKAAASVTGSLDLVETIEECLGSAQIHTKAIQERAESAEAHEEQLEEFRGAWAELHTRLESGIVEIDDSQKRISSGEKRVSELLSQTNALRKQVEELLPGAASAGLAKAYREKSDDLEASQRNWGGIFIVAAIGLSALGWKFLGEFSESDKDSRYILLLVRTLVAIPLVWLGWFAAAQYGSILRLRTDYSFKEASARTFVGYRVHAEELDAENPDQSGSLAFSLGEQTLRILGDDPAGKAQGTFRTGRERNAPIAPNNVGPSIEPECPPFDAE